MLVNGWGDHGNGYGALQVDRRFHLVTTDGIWGKGHLEQAILIFLDYFEDIDEKFPGWNDSQVLEGALCAYNFGVKNVQTLAGMNLGTTGNDYGSDTLARAKWFLGRDVEQQKPLAKPVDPSIPQRWQDVDWGDFDSKVSKYFTVGEECKNSKERIPTEDKIKQTIFEFAKKLDKVREAHGAPLIVTSWYRPVAVNARVGGASRSRHIDGDAADIKPLGDIFEFQRWIDQHWDGALGKGAHKGFVHLDSRNGKGFGYGGVKGARWGY